MIKLFGKGAYLLNGTELLEDTNDVQQLLASKVGHAVSKEEAKKNTISYAILEEHNTSDSMDKLKI